MAYFGKKLQIKNNHLFWENNTPFFLLADTFWYGLTKRVSLKDFETIIQKRKAQGFTAIQLVVGPPPETSVVDDNARSTNGVLPFHKDCTVNPAYFTDIQPKLEILIKHQLVPIIYGSWGNHIDIVGETGMLQLWQQIIKMTQKYPAIYSVTGEVDIFPVNPELKTSFAMKLLHKITPLRKAHSLSRKFQNQGLLGIRLASWQQIAKQIQKLNKAHHPLMVHPHAAKLASELFTDTSWIDIDTFQSGHSPQQGDENMNRNFTKAKLGNKPYLNLEPLYEGIMNQTDITLQQSAFWQSIFAGAAGHCYGAHGIWQFADHDNFMQHWGESYWKESLEYPGAVSLGKAKQWLESEFKESWINFREGEQPISGICGNKLVKYLPDPTSQSTEILGYKLSAAYDTTTYKTITLARYNKPTILVYKQV
ncbi:MAG: DUF4038 domain-containing protein [Weeksellaceae bacterium]